MQARPCRQSKSLRFERHVCRPESESSQGTHEVDQGCGTPVVGIFHAKDHRKDNKKGLNPQRVPTLFVASSSMGSVVTANRQSSVSVGVVLGHLQVSFTEGDDSVARKFCARLLDESTITLRACMPAKCSQTYRRVCRALPQSTPAYSWPAPAATSSGEFSQTATMFHRSPPCMR